MMGKNRLGATYCGRKFDGHPLRHLPFAMVPARSARSAKPFQAARLLRFVVIRKPRRAVGPHPGDQGSRRRAFHPIWLIN